MVFLAFLHKIPPVAVAQAVAGPGGRGWGRQAKSGGDSDRESKGCEQRSRWGWRRGEGAGAEGCTRLAH